MSTKGARVLVLGDYPGDGLARLEADCEVAWRPDWFADDEELLRLIPGQEGLLTPLTQTVGSEVFEAADRLRIVANCAVGVDNIDLVAAARHGVVVTNTPGVLTEDTADLTWALILAVVRRVVSGDRLLRGGGFDGWRPKLHLGRSLEGMTLGVVGAGRIGRAVLARAPAFGVSTVYHQRTRLAPDLEREIDTRSCTLEELLAASDIVSLHATLDADSRHLLDEAAMRSMRRGSYLVNTARGPLVDEAALARLLAEGHLAGAGLDVYEREPAVHSELLDRENVVLLPHLGSATRETRIKMADCCFDDLISLLVAGRLPRRALTSGSTSGDLGGRN